jgi:hypothetical protein
VQPQQMMLLLRLRHCDSGTLRQGISAMSSGS